MYVTRATVLLVVVVPSNFVKCLFMLRRGKVRGRPTAGDVCRSLHPHTRARVVTEVYNPSTRDRGDGVSSPRLPSLTCLDSPRLLNEGRAGGQWASPTGKDENEWSHRGRGGDEPLYREL